MVVDAREGFARPLSSWPLPVSVLTGSSTGETAGGEGEREANGQHPPWTAPHSPLRRKSHAKTDTRCCEELPDDRFESGMVAIVFDKEQRHMCRWKVHQFEIVSSKPVVF
jgi:hypothetical protein